MSRIPTDVAEAVRNAETALRIANAEASLRAEALLQAADLWERAGDETRAEALLRLAVEEDDDSSLDARATLGAFLLRRGQRQEAGYLFEQARKARPD